jgi:hypothetical protein
VNRDQAPGSAAGNPELAASRTRHTDTGGGVVGLFRAAAGERGDEAAFRGGERAAGEVRDREMSEQGWPSGETEALEVASLDFFGDGVAGKEGDAEAFARCAFDRFARAELPDAGGLDPDRSQFVVDRALRARAGLAGEEHELGQPRRRELAVLQRRELRLGDADHFVLEERVELDAIACAGGADECELDAAVQESLEDLLARRDLDFDGDTGVRAAEAAECVRE